MRRTPRFLVLGGWGWLGRIVVPMLLNRGWVVHAPTRRQLDIERGDDVLAACDACRPTHVINLTAAQPGADGARLDTVNATAPRILAEGLAARPGIRLLHMSTDMIFDGRAESYSEDAVPNPMTPYGASKWRGERAVRAILPTALAVRTSLIVDPDVMDRTTRHLAEILRCGEPLDLYSDEMRMPQSRRVLAGAIIDLAVGEYAGVLHVAGSDLVSRHELGSRLLERFRVPGREHIRSIERAALEAAGAAPRPRAIRLDSRRAEAALGRSLPGIRGQLDG